MSSILQVLGLALITTGATLFSIPVGLIVGGIALVLVGLATGRD